MLTVALVVSIMVGVIAVPILWSKYGPTTGIFALIIVTVALVPRKLVTLGPLDSLHAGITTSAVMVSTYTAAIALGVLYCVGHRTFRVPLPFVLFIIATGVLLEPAWGASPEQIAGWVHLTVAVAAWGVGYGISTKLDLNGPSSTPWAAAITWVLIGQTAIVGVTMLGVPLPTFITLTDNVTERAVGTLGNAAILSKATFLLLILLLPLTSSAIKATRRWAGLGVILSLVLTGLTVSRANMVAVGILVAVWSLLVPGRVSIQVRLLLITLGSVAIYFFAGPFIERMDQDQAGTLRPSLMDAALRQINDTPWMGVGINSYVEHVGQFDAVTASGFPVHNTFLLMVAEVGIPLAILFFLPFVALSWRAAKKLRTPGASGAFAWAVVGSIPGLFAIMLTGWGMLSGFSLVMWLFVSGVAAAQIKRPPEQGGTLVLPATRRRQLART